MAEITLRDIGRPPMEAFQGEASAALNSNQKILIKAPAGETLLDWSPPDDGWTVSVTVQMNKNS